VQCTRQPSAALGQEQGRELTLRNLDCQQKNAGWDLIPPLFCCPAAWLQADPPPENLTMPTLNINGKDTAVNADDSTPILWALRDTLGMTGTKFGCGQALCGACTVHLNGAPVRSCVTPISAAVGQKITTIEAIAADDKVGKAVHAAWVKHDVAQCGYCQSGQIMSATALLKGKKKPTDADIDAAMAGNVCRCGTYVRIRAAIHDAAKSLA
jgi:isoquinoline 1-oxidoreductase alpha subunit